MNTRRTFIKQTLMGAGALMVLPAFAMNASGESGIKISLAEWSFHRALKAKKLDHLDFARIAKRDYGINAVEYVNGFFGGSKMNFKKAATDKTYLNEMLKRSQDAGVYNHLLMCDDEGDLSVPNEKTLLQSVENHKKWIEAAKILGCATVRVNLHGKGTPEDRKTASVNALGRLGEFAAPMQINIVVENHGSVTSDSEWLCDVMKQVGKDNVGTLPDFGNFCISDPWGTIQEGCKDMYDIYKGVELLLQYAKGVSAKTYDFDEKGEQPKLDYQKLVGIVKNSGFKGYIGVEFEGKTQSEDTGVRKTQALLAKYL